MVVPASSSSISLSFSTAPVHRGPNAPDPRAFDIQDHRNLEVELEVAQTLPIRLYCLLAGRSRSSRVGAAFPCLVRQNSHPMHTASGHWPVYQSAGTGVSRRSSMRRRKGSKGHRRDKQ